MDRRTFIAVAAVAFATTPRAAAAQQTGGIRRIGVLTAGTIPKTTPAFIEGLREKGWVEGQNLVIERRGADGNAERVPGLAAELAQMNLDVIVSFGAVAAVAIKNATTTIPIVTQSGDPVRLGLVSNLSRPGGNITGLSFFTSEIGSKRLELMKEAMPDIRRVAVIWDHSLPRGFTAPMEAAARTLKIAVELIDVNSADLLESTFSALAKKRVRGALIRETPMLISNAGLVGAIASKHRIAAIGFKEVAEGGGLIGYGADIPTMWRRAATFVDKILKGARPGELPVEQAAKFDLIVNKKTANALGVKFPNSILVQATKVIE